VERAGLALAIGGVVHVDRAEDFVLKKPSYDAHSRKALAPHTGGMNGKPTLATREMGQEIHDRTPAGADRKTERRHRRGT
jgi:hypothetical protein